MTRLFRYTFHIALMTFAIVAVSHAKADAAPSCSVNSPISDLVMNYNPFAAPATITIPANAVVVTCSAANNQTVRVFASGSSSGYTAPVLTGPNSFALSYTMCIPGASPCNATTNVWNTTTGFYQFTTQSNNGTHPYNVPSFQIYLTQQDAPYGTTSQYAGSLYFTTTCNGVAC